MEKNCGGERIGQEMRDMQTLDARKDGRGDASTVASELPSSAAVVVRAGARDMRPARAGNSEGDCSAGRLARQEVKGTAMEHEPTGRMALILEAMRADAPTRVWTPTELAAVSDCRPGKIHATTIRAMEKGLIHRVKTGKNCGYCLELKDGQTVPTTAQPGRREKKPMGHWEPGPDEIRIARYDPTYRFPTMVCARGV